MTTCWVNVHVPVSSSWKQCTPPLRICQRRAPCAFRSHLRTGTAAIVSRSSTTQRSSSQRQKPPMPPPHRPATQPAEAASEFRRDQQGRPSKGQAPVHAGCAMAWRGQRVARAAAAAAEPVAQAAVFERVCVSVTSRGGCNVPAFTGLPSQGGPLARKSSHKASLGAFVVACAHASLHEVWVPDSTF